MRAFISLLFFVFPATAVAETFDDFKSMVGTYAYFKSTDNPEKNEIAGECLKNPIVIAENGIYYVKELINEPAALISKMYKVTTYGQCNWIGGGLQNCVYYNVDYVENPEKGIEGLFSEIRLRDKAGFREKFQKTDYGYQFCSINDEGKLEGSCYKMYACDPKIEKRIISLGDEIKYLPKILE